MRTPSDILTQAKSIQAIATLLCLTVGSAMAGPTGSATTATNTDDVPLLAVGQVTAVGQEAGTITVNGQVFVLDDQTGIYLEPAEGDSASGLADGDSLQEQDYVAIYGEIMDPGLALATVISEIPEAYVAGASEAYLQVILDSNDTATAVSVSGNTVVDYAAALATNDLLGTAAGDVVEFYGLAYGEQFIATDGNRILQDADITGTDTISDALGIRASGVRGIRASGVRGIRASGVRGIRASGVRGIRASGVRGIRASGVRGIRASGVRSISTTTTN